MLTVNMAMSLSDKNQMGQNKNAKIHGLILRKTVFMRALFFAKITMKIIIIIIIIFIIHLIILEHEIDSHQI